MIHDRERSGSPQVAASAKARHIRTTGEARKSTDERGAGEREEGRRERGEEARGRQVGPEVEVGQDGQDAHGADARLVGVRHDVARLREGLLDQAQVGLLVHDFGLRPGGEGGR